MACAFALALGTLVACSDSDVDLDSGGPNDDQGDDGSVNTTGGGDGGGDTGGTSGGTEPEVFSCGSAYRTPTDERVLFDVDVACNHTMFARYGVAAAASEALDAVFVAAAGFEESWVFRVDAETAAPVPDSPQLTQQRMLVTLDAEESLLVAGVADPELKEIAVARLVDGSDGWLTDSVPVPDGVEWLVDLDAAADGTARMWLRNALNFWIVARKVGDGWSLADATLPEGAVAPRFTTAKDGSEVAATHLPGDDIDRWRLGARLGSDATLLLGDELDDHPSSCVPVHTSVAAELASSLPQFAVTSARTDAIVIDSPDSMDASIALPDTALRTSSCPARLDSMECLPECHDVSQGRLDDAFAAARSDDGTVWVAWVDAAVDRRLTYIEACDDGKGSCWCDEAVVEDLSRYSVRLAAVRPDGTIEPALEIPLAENPCGGDVILAPGDALALHAHGSRLAIVVRTSGSDVLPDFAFTLRALLFDTTPAERPR